MNDGWVHDVHVHVHGTCMPERQQVWYIFMWELTKCFVPYIEGSNIDWSHKCNYLTTCTCMYV